MDATPPNRQWGPDPETPTGTYHVTQQRVAIGHGGFIGVGMGDADARTKQKLFADEPTVTLRCALCGWTEKGVPVSKQVAFRLQHEEQRHPDTYRQRQELQQLLRELNRRLWES